MPAAATPNTHPADSLRPAVPALPLHKVAPGQEAREQGGGGAREGAGDKDTPVPPRTSAASGSRAPATAPGHSSTAADNGAWVPRPPSSPAPPAPIGVAGSPSGVGPAGSSTGAAQGEGGGGGGGGGGATSIVPHHSGTHSVTHSTTGGPGPSPLGPECDTGGTGGCLPGVGIPMGLEHLVPGQSYARYLRLRQDPAFLYSCVRVCQLCHIRFTQKAGTRAADLGLVDMVGDPPPRPQHTHTHAHTL